jgi:hypothetical protein
VDSLTATRGDTNNTLLSWSTVSGGDSYQISRGALGAWGSGDYGSCLTQGLFQTTYSDADVPAPGEGFFYLVSAQNLDCGIGSLGASASEAERVNTNAGSCIGVTHTDRHATGESNPTGTVTGTYNDTLSSNNVSESIQEVLSTGGTPASRFSFLEHRWTFNVAAGTHVELHVEGSRTNSTDGDTFRFGYSTNGTNFFPLSTADLPLTDNDSEVQGALPATLSGTVTIRVIDSNRAAGTQSLDTVSIDEIWIRTVP